MTIHDLDTPALLIDLDVMERNLAQMASYAKKHGLRLRPHIKTHKTVALAERQIALGAAGLTVAKPGEAEVMLAARPPGMLIAYPAVGREKLRRLMEVAKRTRLSMALDSIGVARALSEAAGEAQVEPGVLVEVDVGLGRVGVAPGPDLDELIAAVKSLPHLAWDGIAFYPGHIKSLDEQGLAAIEALGQLTARLQDRHQPPILSGGSTPTWMHSHRLPGMNEIRPGTYIFNDGNSVAIGSCESDDCAASILTTVVSARPGQVILDGGSKTFSSDRLVNGEPGFGSVPGDASAALHKLMEEHGFLATENRYPVGHRLRVIPNHVCVAVNLHERIYGVRGKQVEQVWTVDARGKLQ
jgi:D-serine deaminase-like pyridoxal phosphate-dependent protein